MYDALTARYTFACPRRDQAHVALSSFRLLERLPGATHPAVYEVRFDCSCGDEHPGLVSHEDLDWAPLGGHAGAFVDLMTSRVLDSATELRETAAAHLQAGEWPWSFYCYPEGRSRPVFPSSFVAVARSSVAASRTRDVIRSTKAPAPPPSGAQSRSSCETRPGCSSPQLQSKRTS